MRSVRLVLAAAGAAVAALLLSGPAAGATGAPRPPAAPPAPVPAPAPMPVPPPGSVGTGVLTVAYDDGSGRPRTYTLRCGRSARVDPRCDHLARIGGPQGPVPAGQMCSMIYGGPQTATVSGVWAGRPVHETYRRTDGCEVARWAAMVPTLPAPTGTPATPGLRG